MKMKPESNKRQEGLNPCLYQIYKRLYRVYGPQGWWPLCSFRGVNPTKTGSLTGYHPGDYSYPRENSERFEIAVGAICTQNTSWVQAEKAVRNLHERGLLTPEAIISLSTEDLSDLIRPAGYFNQKTKKLKALSAFWKEEREKNPSREALLNIWGVGPETADSILLYSLAIPSFVVDAYTRRIFSRLGLISPESSYDQIRNMFMQNLPEEISCYQEFHALIVEHAKRFCTTKPSCKGCPLEKNCTFSIS